MKQVVFIAPEDSPLAATARSLADSGAMVIRVPTIHKTLQILDRNHGKNADISLILADHSIGVRAARRRLRESGYSIPVLMVGTQGTPLVPEPEVLARPLIGRPLAEVERELIIETLKACGGNRTRASGLLGISIRTMRNKIRQYNTQGIPVPAPPSAPVIPLLEPSSAPDGPPPRRTLR